MEKFKQALLSMWVRLKNPGTVLAVASGIVLIMNELGMGVDSAQVTTIVNTVCGILIALGIMNDSTGQGAYIPGVKDKLMGQDGKEEE